ncbi:MAG: hypothetical protein H7A09_03540 [Oceanospirillaceae bacterium]|nr:hypothetical protein [Oceanospirillaceae bacterium]MCP5335871.1 hypothetical protein [Oceanospirillaceae bacterium]MCP5350345.1 hypothetical protein [Oceanospirillaceae bacterium]
MLKLLYRHNHLLAMSLSMCLIMGASLQILQEKFAPHPCASCVAVHADGPKITPARAAVQSSLVVSQLASMQLERAVKILPQGD